jgi:hypothetical protein
LLIGRKQGQQHCEEELKESDEQAAERLIGEMLRQAGWSEAELKRRRKGHPKKARMAARLRAETTMTWEWIGQTFGNGALANSGQCSPIGRNETMTFAGSRIFH